LVYKNLVPYYQEQVDDACIKLLARSEMGQEDEVIYIPILFVGDERFGLRMAVRILSPEDPNSCYWQFAVFPPPPYWALTLLGSDNGGSRLWIKVGVQWQ
jgi:hypothetical protein